MEDEAIAILRARIAAVVVALIIIGAVIAKLSC